MAKPRQALVALFNQCMNKINDGIAGTAAVVDTTNYGDYDCLVNLTLDKFSCSFSLEGSIDTRGEPLIIMTFRATNYKLLNINYITTRTIDELMDEYVRQMQSSYVAFAGL